MGTTEYKGRKLYKVLVNGKSCHNGNLTWSLPRQKDDGSWEPGEWHEVEGELQLCQRGLHLTWDPIKWADRPGIEVYEVEAIDLGDDDEQDSKVVVRKCRLVRAVTVEAELLALHILSAGHHQVRDGQWYASDSASVEARSQVTVISFPCRSCGLDHSDGKTIRLIFDRAVHVDRRKASPIVTIATEAAPEEP